MMLSSLSSSVKPISSSNTSPRSQLPRALDEHEMHQKYVRALSKLNLSLPLRHPPSMLRRLQKIQEGIETRDELDSTTSSFGNNPTTETMDADDSSLQNPLDEEKPLEEEEVEKDEDEDEARLTEGKPQQVMEDVEKMEDQVVALAEESPPVLVARSRSVLEQQHGEMIVPSPSSNTDIIMLWTLEEETSGGGGGLELESSFVAASYDIGDACSELSCDRKCSSVDNAGDINEEEGNDEEEEGGEDGNADDNQNHDENDIDYLNKIHLPKSASLSPMVETVTTTYDDDEVAENAYHNRIRKQKSASQSPMVETVTTTYDNDEVTENAYLNRIHQQKSASQSPMVGTVTTTYDDDEATENTYHSRIHQQKSSSRSPMVETVTTTYDDDGGATENMCKVDRQKAEVKVREDMIPTTSSIKEKIESDCCNNDVFDNNHQGGQNNDFNDDLNHTNDYDYSHNNVKRLTQHTDQNVGAKSLQQGTSSPVQTQPQNQKRQEVHKQQPQPQQEPWFSGKRETDFVDSSYTSTHKENDEEHSTMKRSDSCPATLSTVVPHKQLVCAAAAGRVPAEPDDSTTSNKNNSNVSSSHKTKVVQKFLKRRPRQVVLSASAPLSHARRRLALSASAPLSHVRSTSTCDSTRALPRPSATEMASAAKNKEKHIKNMKNITTLVGTQASEPSATVHPPRKINIPVVPSEGSPGLPSYTSMDVDQRIDEEDKREVSTPSTATDNNPAVATTTAGTTKQRMKHARKMFLRQHRDSEAATNSDGATRGKSESENALETDVTAVFNSENKAGLVPVVLHACGDATTSQIIDNATSETRFRVCRTAVPSDPKSFKSEDGVVAVSKSDSWTNTHRDGQGELLEQQNQTRPPRQPQNKLKPQKQNTIQPVPIACDAIVPPTSTLPTVFPKAKTRSSFWKFGLGGGGRSKQQRRTRGQDDQSLAGRSQNSVNIFVINNKAGSTSRGSSTENGHSVMVASTVVGNEDDEKLSAPKPADSLAKDDRQKDIIDQSTEDDSYDSDMKDSKNTNKVLQAEEHQQDIHQQNVGTWQDRQTDSPSPASFILESSNTDRFDRRQPPFKGAKNHEDDDDEDEDDDNRSSSFSYIGNQYYSKTLGAAVGLSKSTIAAAKEDHGRNYSTTRQREVSSLSTLTHESSEAASGSFNDSVNYTATDGTSIAASGSYSSSTDNDSSKPTKYYPPQLDRRQQQKSQRMVQFSPSSQSEETFSAPSSLSSASSSAFGLMGNFQSPFGFDFMFATVMSGESTQSGSFYSRAADLTCVHLGSTHSVSSAGSDSFSIPSLISFGSSSNR
ncbi:hypothetical protein ACA910_002656 [Epithemia clementina (nom. ined.)]